MTGRILAQLTLYIYKWAISISRMILLWFLQCSWYWTCKADRFLELKLYTVAICVWMHVTDSFWY